MNLIGKKILVIHKKDTFKPQCKTSVILGCDPDIGICITDIDNPKPWFIIQGPLSPEVKNKNIIFDERDELIYNYITNMLKSGYLSMELLHDFMYEINYDDCNESFQSLGNSSLSCPYSN